MIERTCDQAAAAAAAERFLPTVNGANAPPAPLPPPDPTRERDALQATLRVLLANTAARLGPKWEMEPAEADAIAEPLAELVQRWLGDASTETRLYLALGAYAMPRMLGGSLLALPSSSSEPSSTAAPIGAAA